MIAEAIHAKLPTNSQQALSWHFWTYFRVLLQVLARPVKDARFRTHLGLGYACIRGRLHTAKRVKK